MANSVFLIVLEGGTKATSESAYFNGLKKHIKMNPTDQSLLWMRDNLGLKYAVNVGYSNGVHVKINKKIKQFRMASKKPIVLFVHDDDTKTDFDRIFKLIDLDGINYFRLFSINGNFENFICERNDFKTTSTMKKTLNYKKASDNIFNKIYSHTNTDDGVKNLIKYRNNYSEDAMKLIDFIKKKT